MSKIILSLKNELIFNNKYISIKTLVINDLSSKEIIFFIKFLKYSKEEWNSLNDSSNFSSEIGSSFASLLLKYK